MLADHKHWNVNLFKQHKVERPIDLVVELMNHDREDAPDIPKPLAVQFHVEISQELSLLGRVARQYKQVATVLLYGSYGRQQHLQLNWRLKEVALEEPQHLPDCCRSAFDVQP